MTKQEFVRANHVDQMPRMVQVLIGRLWDAASSEGERIGRRKGVDDVARKQEEIYQRMYQEGINDVKKRLGVSLPAAMAKVLHRDFRFGAQRCGRMVDAVSEELQTMLDPADVVRECAQFGFLIDCDDSFWWELEG